MIRIEQFLYTTTATGPLPGYRVVSKSPGITDGIIADLEHYMLPAGIDARYFKQSVSMVTIRGGKQVAYSLAKNIGRGPDGRPDAMSNHTLVIDMKSFEALSYDTRFLDRLFLDSFPTTPLLPSVTVQEDAEIPSSRDLAKTQAPLLTHTLHSLVRGRGVAVQGTCGVQFVQGVLGILPPSLRLVPFSTCAVDLELQPAYRLILLGGSPARNLPKGFDVVDGRSCSPLRGSETERAVRYMVAMTSVRGPDLVALHTTFEKLISIPPRKRLAVLTAILRMAQSPGPVQNDKDAQMTMDHLAELDSETLDEVLSGLGTHTRLNYHSDLAILIKERRALYHISDYGANRSSVETLLGQADGEGRQSLLLALYKSKRRDVVDNIDQLFVDFTYSYYNMDFFRFVVSVPDLAHRFKEFAGMHNKNQFRRQAAVRNFVFALLESDAYSLIEPALFKPYDLDSGYDLDSFGSLFSEVFSSVLGVENPNFCNLLATAGLSYMAGFGRSYGHAQEQSRRYNAARFGTLADRLAQMALGGGETPYDKRGNPKDRGRIARMMRECGIAASGTGGRSS